MNAWAISVSGHGNLGQRSLSDGFFTVSVLFIGCSILMFIQDAGNFYFVGRGHDPADQVTKPARFGKWD